MLSNVVFLSRLGPFSLRSIFLQLAMLGLTSVGAVAQSTTQKIQGLVTDPSGAVIAGAKVTIINEGTGVVNSVLTNETGNYSFPLVPVGNYDLKCEMQGFKTETVKALRVETAAQVRQNFEYREPDRRRSD
jgi:hypothetical protein